MYITLEIISILFIETVKYIKYLRGKNNNKKKIRESIYVNEKKKKNVRLNNLLLNMASLFVLHVRRNIL